MALNIQFVVLGCFAFAIQSTLACGYIKYCDCLTNVQAAKDNYEGQFNKYYDAVVAFRDKFVPEVEAKLVLHRSDVEACGMSLNAIDYIPHIAMMLGRHILSKIEFTPVWKDVENTPSDQHVCRWLIGHSPAMCGLTTGNIETMTNYTTSVEAFNLSFAEIIASCGKSTC